MIKNQISAFMDGELDENEARILFGQLKQDAKACDEWKIYHLVGDNLRRTPVWDDGFSMRFAEKLAAEPLLPAPPRHFRFKRTMAATFSVAVSLAAVSLVAWTFFQPNPPNAPQISDGDIPRDVSHYLVAHQEYYAAPMGANTRIPGGTSYLSASLDSQRKNK